MKIMQIENGFVHWDATQSVPDLDWAASHYSSEIKFVEAPDYVFEGWTFDESQEGDARFIKPIPPEGWGYDDRTGAFYLLDNPPVRPVPIEAQLNAALDRQQFLEDCIAEMATQVYS